MGLAAVGISASANGYAEYDGKTSWNGHGGIEIDTDDTAPINLDVSSCESRCDADDACSCVSFRPSDGKCWKRSSCNPSEFGVDADYNTFVKQSPAPAPQPTPEPTPGTRNCLCIFDIDRTLTGKQGDTENCPANLIQSGVEDWAYGKGGLTLSELAQAVEGTFCSGCHVGVISAGDAHQDGSAERSVLHDRLAAADAELPDDWAAPGCDGTTPLVTSCTDGQKQNAVPGILRWYKQNLGAEIADSDVHFFDDRVSNVEPFRGTAYNARQISCASRDDGGKGYCGAQLNEIVSTPGVATCDQQVMV